MTISSDIYGRWPFTWQERAKILELDFALEEYERRVAVMRRAMVQRQLDAIFIYAGEAPKDKVNVRYLAGWDSFFGDSFLLLPLESDPVLVTNSILHGEPMHSNIQTTWVRDFRACLAFGATLKLQSVVGHLLDTLQEKGLRGKRMGYCSTRWTPARIDQELRASLTEEEMIDASALLSNARSRKSAAEIAVIRSVAHAASEGMALAMKAAIPGNTEHDVAAALHYGMIRAGADFSPLGMRLQAGTRSALKNVFPLKGKVIKAGELVSIDSSGSYLGYWSDHARTIVAGGEPTAQQLDLMDTCAQAWSAGFAAAKPGNSPSQVYRAMNAVVAGRGHSEWDWSLGHSFGLDLTEAPIFSPDNHTPLEPGNTFFLEPMIVPTNVGSVCYEDAIAITATGAEKLTTTPVRVWEN
jgi:Xaa-Pro dipeptidase